MQPSIESIQEGVLLVKASMHSILIDFDDEVLRAQVYDSSEPDDEPVAFFTSDMSRDDGELEFRQPGIEMIVDDDGILFVRFPDTMIRLDFDGTDAVLRAYDDPWPSSTDSPAQIIAFGRSTMPRLGL